MAYADRNTGGSRIVAIVLVALIVAGIGYAFVTGLAYQYVKKAADKLNTFDVAEPPPPEEVPPPPPPPDSPVPPPPTMVVTPPAIVSVPQPSPPMMTTPVPQPAPPISPPAPPAPVAPPAPPAISKAAAAKGNPASWVTNDDYPPSSLRAEEQGKVGITFSINAQGRVEGCTVTSPSGFSSLDKATCSLVTRRGRYSPALDAAGNPIAGGRKTLRFTWQIQQ